MKRVLANATADLVSESGPSPLWRVEVTGQPPHAAFRVYFLPGSEKDAAFEGIRMFCREMERKGSLQ